MWLQLQEIIETDIKYAVLDGLLMENIQDFLQPINKAHDEITKKPYDHLDIRSLQFGIYFLLLLVFVFEFQTKIEHFHLEMMSLMLISKNGKAQCSALRRRCMNLWCST